MKLYYMQGACPLATHIVLEWTGAPCESVALSHDELKQEPFLSLNPLGAVPVLEVDGTIMTQNGGILTYLAEAWPKAGLGGDGTARGKAEVHRWLGLVNSDIHPAFKPMFGATRYLGDEAMIEKSKENARSQLRTLFEVVNMQLATRDWIAGTRSIADAYLYVVLRWAQGTGVDLAGLDGVARFIARMEADAGVQRALAIEGLA
ncbi:MAG: glutathione S-transferase N-terminal domain-containing protein [Rubellimicrobium sp.]|nr:glutathione S-transferase N-terminal domain-containing protein [Rubellimicrobium sp.]